MEICDCTLRDGGYYTNWDFDKKLVQNYFKAMNEIPAITHIEIGYRSKPMKEYFGEYFYCPPHVMEMARSMCPNKTLAVMLNEKDTSLEDLDILLDPCKDFVDLIRMAVDPKNIERATNLAKEVKKKGFAVGFNLMYMSQWSNDQEFIKGLRKLEDKVDYIYLVDSFGGVYPEDISQALETIKSTIKIPIGFHGHNNMELGLANSLEAIRSGSQIIDATITGMGRGAGNLKTELLLTCLNSKEAINIDFNKLNSVVAEFETLQKQYAWGTNLPYMISGAYSLPQKEVMSWIAKRRYTTESIINALQNRKNNLSDNHKIPILKNEKSAQQVVIIGGGPNTLKHAHALKIYCKKYPDTVLVHAGTRYVENFNDLTNRQYYCLLGAEGYKLQKSLPKLNLNNVKCILEPSPRKMGTILPDEIVARTFELPEISLSNDYPDSLLTIAFQLVLDLQVEEVLFFGLDGYDIKTDEQMIEVSKENQLLIDYLLTTKMKVVSLLPTNYQNIVTQSIYSLIQ